MSSIANVDSPVPGYFQTTLIPLTASQTFDDIMGSSSTIPSSASLTSMLDQIRSMHGSIALKGEKFDLMMRELSKKQREREQEEREREREKERQAQEEERRKEKTEKAKAGTHSSIPKKREREEDRPLAVGAHREARQDGGPMDQGTCTTPCLHTSAISCPPRKYHTDALLFTMQTTRRKYPPLPRQSPPLPTARQALGV
ncbi:MAG: hypothetical protein INR71_08070 [Terriglobus roseus]|nr:hypothetical protein [Terriglobus roseus]